jgi:hypothetical protein
MPFYFFLMFVQLYLVPPKNVNELSPGSASLLFRLSNQTNEKKEKESVKTENLSLLANSITKNI